MAIRKYFINLGADPSTALVESFSSDVAQSADRISFWRDDALDIELHFLNINPAADRQPGRPFVYVDPTGWTVKVGAGSVDNEPTGGTFTITDPAASQTSAAIAYNASAATVQSAIRAALTTNFSACTVSGDAGGPWTIDRVTTGAFTTNPTTTTAAITPSGSVGVVINTEDGTSALSEKWQLSLASAMPIYKDTGWSALSSASVTVTKPQAGLNTPAGSKKNTIFRIQWNSDAYSGNVSLLFTGDTVSGTVSFPYNATEAQMVTAFELHTDVDDGGVVVIQNGPGDYTVECVGAGIKESATPALATAVNTLSVPVGLTARLGCNTALVNSLLAGATSATCSFEVEIQRSGSNAETVANRDDCTLHADLIRNSAGSSTAVPTYPNVNSVVNFSNEVVGYTGGGATNLDGLVTASTLSAGYYIEFVHATDGPRTYQLTTGTAAESSPDTIRPDDYNASTNAKVWLSRR